MSPFPSDKSPDADNGPRDNGFEGLQFFGPVRFDRPPPVAAVLAPAILMIAIILAALVGFNYLLPGGMLALLLMAAEAAIRWPAVIALPVILAVLAWAARK